MIETFFVFPDLIVNLCVSFLFVLIYLSPFFIGVGFGTGFPIIEFPQELLVGCQWVNEPILSPLLYKLIHT